jgi:hypothetical protein
MSDSSQKMRFGLWYDFRNPAQWRQPSDRLCRLDQITWGETNGFGGHSATPRLEEFERKILTRVKGANRRAAIGGLFEGCRLSRFGHPGVGVGGQMRAGHASIVPGHAAGIASAPLLGAWYRLEGSYRVQHVADLTCVYLHLSPSRRQNVHPRRWNPTPRQRWRIFPIVISL